MSESAPEGTTAGDLQAGGDTGKAAGDEGRTDGAATPDEPGAERAQEGVQAAFE